MVGSWNQEARLGHDACRTPVAPSMPSRPRFSSQYFPGCVAASRGSLGRVRGFTLIELMVVVLLITIFAVIALPGIARQLDARQARSSAETVATLYRNARLRAMGRGAAQLVIFNAGQLQLREAIQGTTLPTGCETLPATSCTTTNWADAQPTNQLLENYDATAGGQITVSMTNLSGDAPYAEICFTPLGATFVRATNAAAWQPLTQAPRISLENANGNGTRRDVVILPNGSARVKAQ